MTTAVLINHVAAYAAAVRKHLGDLSPEQVEDLTDGLEADLAEALDDPTVMLDTGTDDTSVLDLTVRFGSPEAYAEELRSAAGLPAVAPAGARRRRRSPATILRTKAEPLVRSITSHRRWPAVRDFLVSMRPAWWVARGWSLFTIGVLVGGGTVMLVPRDIVALVVLVLLIILSVQHGRGLWSPPSRFGGAVTALNVLAIVALPIAAANQGGIGDETYAAPYFPDESVTADGVYIDGERVKNLFVYGPDGIFIEGAQIIDDRSRPVAVAGPDGIDDPDRDLTTYWAPQHDEFGRDVWNAYPLPTWTNLDADWDGVEWVDGEGWVLPEDAETTAPRPPVAQLAAIAVKASGASSDTGAPAGDLAATDPAVPIAPTAPAAPEAVPPASS